MRSPFCHQMWFSMWRPHVVLVLVTKCGYNFNYQMWSLFWWPNLPIRLALCLDNQIWSPFWWPNTVTVLMTKCGHRFDDQIRWRDWQPNLVVIFDTWFGRSFEDTFFIRFGASNVWFHDLLTSFGFAFQNWSGLSDQPSKRQTETVRSRCNIFGMSSRNLTTRQPNM